MAEKGNAVVLVQRDDNLAVARRFEVEIGSFGQFGADAFVVVELAVDDSVDCLVGIVKRLFSGRREIVDSESNMAECFNSVSARWQDALHV